MLISKQDIEKGVLSALILDNDEFFKHDFRIDFFTGLYQKLFETIKSIIESGGSADLPTIYAKRSQGITAEFINSVCDYPVSANLEYSIKELSKAKDLRNIHQALLSSLEMCQRFEDVSRIESLVNTSFLNMATSPIDHRKQMQESFESIRAIAENEAEIGISTGIEKLDKIIGGIGKQKLVIIAGRPGDGKSSLAMNLVRNFCYFGKSGVVFTLEMSTAEIVDRFVCDIMSIDGSLIFQGRSRYLQRDQKQQFLQSVEQAYGIIHDWPIIIDDRPRQTIDDIMSQSRKHKAQAGIEWIVIDHSREINGWNTEGQESKSEIVSKCKSLAKELDLPVLLLSQLNRKIEDRNKSKPKNSDLKDTGALEEKADLILFPYVEDREGYTRDDMYKKAMIYVTKNRGGNIGVVSGLKWQGHYFRFSDNNFSF